MSFGDALLIQGVKEYYPLESTIKLLQNLYKCPNQEILMKITKIEVNNFRLLKDFSLDLEEELSLIIGKNNTGKTSVLAALDKFLNSSEKKKITINDFNVDLKNQLIELIEKKDIGNEDHFIPLGISLILYIEYDASDDLSKVQPLIMNLSPADRNIVLSFEYKISFQRLVDMRKAYEVTKEKYKEKIGLFLEDQYTTYFGAVKKKSLLITDHSKFIELDKENISLKGILAFEYISAKRDVTNKDNNKTLSTQTSRIYKESADSKDQSDIVESLKDKLRSTDGELTTIYGSLFSSLLKKVAKYGGVKDCETNVKITSTLQYRELLDDNTTVLYTHNDHDLPEHYNGLGYMNLISIIFEIEILMSRLRRSLSEAPAAINLLFIEEPEAHTHPQMQCIFIKNIKALLRESRKRKDGIEIQLQTAISTHSSHIVSECEFDDVKYLKKDTIKNSVVSINLKSLKNQYSSNIPEEDEMFKKYFKFLKQYLTLNKSELFFADKVILIEGDTERILLPAMMKKIDQASSTSLTLPLLSQNISIVEVGAHSQTFEKFIDFIGVKTLVITDLDSYFVEEDLEDDGVTKKLHANGKVKTKTVPCQPTDPKAKCTSNNSLKFFHKKNSEDLDYFKNLNLDKKLLLKSSNEWSVDEKGNLLLVYQTLESGYQGRSFEDAFFKINKTLLGSDSLAFPSLTKKWFDKYINNEIDAFVFANNAVTSKPSLAIEILLNSTTTGDIEFSNWEVPHYIQEGLEWLRKD